MSQKTREYGAESSASPGRVPDATTHPSEPTTTTTTHRETIGKKNPFKTRLVKPFRLDLAVDWLSKADGDERQLDRNWDGAGYADRVVYGEFDRFILSDQMGIYLSLCGSIFTFIYCFATLDVSESMRIYFGSLGAGLFILFFLGFYLHHFGGDTRATAGRLKWLHTLIGTFLIAGLASTFQEAAARCASKPDTLSFLPWREGVDRRDPEVIWRSCHHIYSPVIVFGIIVALYCLRMSPHRVGVMCFCYSICVYFSPFWSERIVPFTAREYGTVLFLFGFTLIQAMTTASVRHVLVMRQFETVVSVEMERRRAQNRETELDALLTSMLPSSVLQKLIGFQNQKLSNNQNINSSSSGGGGNGLSSSQQQQHQLLSVYDTTDQASVLFSDMVHFTAWSSARTPQDVVSMLNTLCIRLDSEATKLAVEKVKTIGDAYWAASGLPVRQDDHADRLVTFGLSMLSVIAEENELHPDWNGIEFRVGESCAAPLLYFWKVR